MEAKTNRGPIRSDSLEWEEWSHGAHFGSRVRELSRLGGATHVGVVLEELAPGRQSCPVHYHMLEEEHLFALAGRATLIWGDTSHELQSGDYVCFPAGEARAHALVNHGSEVFRFLMIGEKNANEVCFYPDSDKLMVRAAGAVFRKTDKVDYWEGEPGRDAGSRTD